MINLKKLFQANGQHLANHVQRLAESHGFAEHVQARGMPWQRSVTVLTDALLHSLETQGLDGCHATAKVTCDDDLLAQFAVKTSRKHRKDGTPLSLFMAMLKFYRESYLELLRREGMEKTVAERAFVHRFFDRMEITQCVDWVRVAEEEKLLQAKAGHRALAEEKNRFLALFESLISSVFLLDADMRIEIMNQAAADLTASMSLSGKLHYARPSPDRSPQAEPERISLADSIPWLHEALEDCRNQDGTFDERRFDMTRELEGRTHYFTIAISPVFDSLDRFRGSAIVMDDVTEQAEMEMRLARERDMAAEYLDVVGAIVVAVDISGAIQLINQTGCDVLGYENEELLGKKWADVAVHEDERDELNDYFYTLAADPSIRNDRRTNSIVTRDGQRFFVAWNNRVLFNEGGVPTGILSSGMDVTERRRMEAALEEKELWLRSTFVALNEAVLLLTPDRHIMDANPAAEIMFQRTHKELTGMSIAELHKNDEASEQYAEITREAFEQGRTAEFEFDLSRKDGTTFPSDNSVSLMTNDEGMPLGVVNVIRDVSRRKEAETVLRKSEEKFRRIFESMKDGFIVTDLDGVIQMVNPATCAMLGYTEEELVGRDTNILYAKPEERTALRDQLITNGIVNSLTLSAAKKDGSSIMVESNSHIVLDDDGTPLVMEGTFRDITARLQAEKMLREREKLYRAFFENNHAIMLLEDPKTGDIVDANPAASDFYGYSVKEMRAMNMNQINAINQEEVFQEMFTARAENRSYFIFRHTLADGEVRDVEVYSGPILVRGKQLLYSVIHDVTARISLERDMKRMATTDALTGANNRHQFFLMAHQEFKRAKRYGHPLGVIMLDIDYFKSINDDYGHQTGDEVLQALATTALETMRDADIFGRLGGEEFAAILPETSAEEARIMAERLRSELAKLIVEAKDQLISFTVSVGVTMAEDRDVTLEETLNRADESLYKAKRGGRNRVVVG